MKALLLILVTSLCLAACDKCKKLSCENAQPCEDGECACSEWYEGESCEAITVQRYAGTYAGDLACAGSEGQDQLEVISTGLTNVLVMEVSGSEVEMRFSDIHQFELTPETMASPIGDYTISGTGNITGNMLSMELHYELEGSSVSFSCNIDMYK